MNNQVTIVGCVNSAIYYSHDCMGELHYKTVLTVMRDSGTADKIPLIIPDHLLLNAVGWVAVRGQFRSYIDDGKLLLFVYAQDISPVDPDSVNDAYLDGVIAKKPTYRHTPLGREIADIMLNVERDYGKSDRIPCICWGRTAKYASHLKPGSRIRVAGRVQSRDYVKNGEIRTAYELSANLLEVV